jgi:hypothetical protein
MTKRIYQITVDPQDGTFDPDRDLENVTAESPEAAIAFVRTLPWVRRFPEAIISVARIIDTRYEAPKRGSGSGFKR